MNNWKQILAPVLSSAVMTDLKEYIKTERNLYSVYPEGKNVFRAFDLCPFDNTKVVIIGTEPYNTPGTADGLAYSTQQAEIPPALLVIFREIYRDLNIQYLKNVTFEEFFPSSNLEKWAKEGFLLLYATLTVSEKGQGSHKDKGWEKVITAAIEALNKKKDQVIFLLWGDDAKKYEKMIDNNFRHLVFTAADPALDPTNENHPFYGSRHFSIVRDILPSQNLRNIMPTARLDSCFDKVKAKQIVRENYPFEADKMCKYIDDNIIINVPINKDIYWAEVRRFESIISTKTEIQ